MQTIKTWRITTRPSASTNLFCTKLMELLHAKMLLWKKDWISFAMSCQISNGR
jgi:hypothetical protein